MQQKPEWISLKKLLALCADFLQNYADVEGLEEKYREVYKVQSGLEKYGSTEADFKIYFDKIEAARKKAAEEEASRIPAKVYVIRHTGMGGSAVGFMVFIDEKAVCKLNNGNFTLLSVTKGKHELAAQPRGSTDLKDKTDTYTLMAEPGKTYYLEIKMNAWSGKLRLEPLSEEEGRKEMARSKQDTCTF